MTHLFVILIQKFSSYPIYTTFLDIIGKVHSISEVDEIMKREYGI